MKILSQTSFSAGEISPILLGRSETDERGRGLEQATNVICSVYGLISRRNGSRFVALTKDPLAAIRLAKYQFSKDVAYILEFGNQYIRFFTEGAQVVESALNITGITKANPGVITSNSHGLSNNDQVYITNVSGMVEINDSNIPYIVANVTANTFTLKDIDGNAINTTSYTTYTSGGNIRRIYTLASPWTTAQLSEITYVQSGLDMYIAHPETETRVLQISSSTDWSLSLLSPSPPPTYESGYESTGTTITPSATSGTGVTFTAGASIFLAGDEGRQIINLSSGETGAATITSVTSGTVAVCDIVENFTDTNAIASADWKLGLSPVVALEFDGTQTGSIVTVRSEHQTSALGPSLTITGITQANPAVVTSNAHGLSNGQLIQIQDVVGMTQLNNKQFTVEGVTANTFQLKAENSTAYTAYTSGGIARRALSGEVKNAFRSADVGKYILANGGALEIISILSASSIKALVHKSLNTAASTNNWSLEVPTWTPARGYPRAVGLFEQRLVLAGTETQPQTVWMSESGIFNGFGAGPDDEDSIEIELVSNEVNTTNWLYAARDLIVGTTGGEISISSGTSGAVTPSSNKQQPRTYHGSVTQQAIPVKDEVVFVQREGRKLRTLKFEFDMDSYSGEDITFLSEHLTEGIIKEAVYGQEPDSIIYAVTEQGKLLCGVYDRPKSVIGWSESDTNGNYESVQTLPGEVWVSVKRTINGKTRRYIELMTKSDGSSDTDGFSDSYITISSPLTITNITTANPAVVTSASHGLSNGDKVIIKSLVDTNKYDLDPDKSNMSDINGNTYTVANVTANTFELSGLDATNYNSYSSGGKAFKKITILTGLDHLEGKAVQIKADGAVMPDEVVTSGSITLSRPAGEIVIGLRYLSTLKTISQEFDLGQGSMQGQRVRWARPLLRVYKSAKPRVNDSFLPSGIGSDGMGKKVPLFTGFLEYGGQDWSDSSSINIEIDDPLPFNLLAITGTVKSGVR